MAYGAIHKTHATRGGGVLASVIICDKGWGEGDVTFTAHQFYFFLVEFLNYIMGGLVFVTSY